MFGQTIINKFESIIANKIIRQTSFYTILLIMAALTFRDLYSLMEEYREENKKAKIDIIFNDTMTFPNITFCMSKIQAWSHFNMKAASNSSEWEAIVKENLDELKDKDSFLKRRWDFRLAAEAYQVVMTLNSLERETSEESAIHALSVFRLSPRLAGSRKLVSFWLAEIEKRGVTFSEFQQKTGIETLKRLLERFQRLSYDENEIFRSRIRITWISQFSMCFQPDFDQENFKDITDQGEFFVLQLSHNLDNLNGEQIDCMSLDMHGRPASMARFMEGKGRTNDGYVDELCLGQRYEVEVDVKSKYISLEDLETDDGTACRVYENGENEFDCHSKCRMEYIQSICNCTPMTLEYLANNDDETYSRCNYEKCILDFTNLNATKPAIEATNECKKKCIANCVQIRYNITPFNKGTSSRPDLTEITVIWMSFEYLQMEQELVYTPASFFAALGGAMGLWLGLSILSLIQFLIFLSARFSNKVVEKLLRKQHEDAHQMETRNNSIENDNKESRDLDENNIDKFK